MNSATTGTRAFPGCEKVLTPDLCECAPKKYAGTLLFFCNAFADQIACILFDAEFTTDLIKTQDTTGPQSGCMADFQLVRTDKVDKLL